MQNSSLHIPVLHSDVFYNGRCTIQYILYLQAVRLCLAVNVVIYLVSCNLRSTHTMFWAYKYASDLPYYEPTGMPVIYHTLIIPGIYPYYEHTSISVKMPFYEHKRIPVIYHIISIQVSQWSIILWTYKYARDLPYAEHTSILIIYCTPSIQVSQRSTVFWDTRIPVIYHTLSIKYPEYKYPSCLLNPEHTNISVISVLTLWSYKHTSGLQC